MALVQTLRRGAAVAASMPGKSRLDSSSKSSVSPRSSPELSHDDPMEQRLEEGERRAEGETLASAALPLQLVVVGGVMGDHDASS